MNFTTLLEHALLLESGWTMMPNPPDSYELHKKVIKTLKDKTAAQLRKAFQKAMDVDSGAWEISRKGRSWEQIFSGRAYAKLNLPNNVKIWAFNIGGPDHARALGYVNNNVYQVMYIGPHEEYNKYVS